MARWKKRQDFLPTVTLPWATAQRWEITREFPIESIALGIRLNMTQLSGGTSPTYTVTNDINHPWTMIKRITVTVADGATTRNVVDISGPSLAAWFRQVNGTLGTADRWATDYNSAVWTAVTTAFNFVLPIPFALPNLADPIGSTLCLPAPRYNSNIILTVETDVQSVFATLGGTQGSGGDQIQITPIVYRREITDPNWPFYQTELAEVKFPLAYSQSQQMFELQVPGAYTGILLRGYNSVVNTATKAGDPSAGVLGGTPSTNSGEFSLRMLGQVIRRFKWDHVAIENEWSMATPEFVIPAGNNMKPGWQPTAFLDFLNDRPGQCADHLGSTLDTNPLMATGARLQLYADNLASSGTQYITAVTHRIFGVLNDLKPAGT